MVLAVKPLDELCHGRRRTLGLLANIHASTSEPSTTLGTFSFVFIHSSDPRNPKTMAGKMRSDGAYVLSNGYSRVTGVLIPLKRGELEDARKSGEEIWGSMETLEQCSSDARMCLIKGVVPHLFQQHFVLKRGVYKVE